MADRLTIAATPEVTAAYVALDRAWRAGILDQRPTMQLARAAAAAVAAGELTLDLEDDDEEDRRG